MTNPEREALVERMAEQIHVAIRTARSKGWDALPWAEVVAACDGLEGTNGFALLCARRNAARAALSEAERVVREDEREACARVADAHKQQYRKEQGQFPRNPARWQHCGDAAQTLATAIRARGAA